MSGRRAPISLNSSAASGSFRPLFASGAPHAAQAGLTGAGVTVPLGAVRSLSFESPSALPDEEEEDEDEEEEEEDEEYEDDEVEEDDSAKRLRMT